MEHVSDSIAIMYLGRIVEIGPADTVFAKPAHPYTRALMEAIPVADPDVRRESAPVKGEAPSPVSPPPGLPVPSALPLRDPRVPRSDTAARAGRPDERRAARASRRLHPQARDLSVNP